MGWYEAIKDAVNLAQKADNIDLMRKLLDAQKELLELQADNQNLRMESWAVSDADRGMTRVRRRLGAGPYLARSRPIERHACPCP